MKHTYFLISTTNAAVNGWSVYGRGSKREMEELRDSHPAFIDKTPQHRDIYAQTLAKNARVVSKTKARKVYKIDI